MAQPPASGGKPKAPGDKADDQPEPGAETGMQKRDLKRLLVRARRKPVQCALGQGDSEGGSVGLVLLHPRRPGRALLKDLKEQFPGMSRPAFGTASVDADGDANLVVFNVNKSQPGLDRKLMKSIRGTGFKRVSMETGGGDDDEDGDGDDE